MPKFSIIIPAYNAEDRIRKVLHSVRYQENITDYELIVVCDSCTDNTAKIAREEFDAIVVEENYENDGLSRNKGLDIAIGDWVLFLDDDDYWLHEYVLDMINSALEVANHKLDILQFGFIWKGKGYCASNIGKNGLITLYSNVWTKCFRREFIGDTRFPNIYSISDSKFVSALLAKRPIIKVLDHPMYYYNYMRVGSITETSNKEENT